MSRIVVKFGGTSVANPERIEKAAMKVAAEVKRGHQVAVVVSAMAGMTNQLIDYCKQITPDYDESEHDAVVAAGEQIVAGLMAMALRKHGVTARSFQGWQVPILCDFNHRRARIIDIPTANIEAEFAMGSMPVIAGFQGVTAESDITTLGRGGSDTTAVAIAAALKADRCDIYTDVDGVYTTDPRVTPQAHKIDRISYEEMLELASLGAKVLHTRSVELAMAKQVPVQVLSSFDDAIGSDLPGTLVTKEEDIVEQMIVNGVAFTRNEAKVTMRNVPDVPGVAANIFGPLAEASLNVDMIVQNISSDGKSTDMTFTVSREDLQKAIEILKKIPALNGIEIESDATVAKLSVVGIGMRSHSGVAQKMFRALAEKNINILVITTSEIKVSVLVSDEYVELGVRALHTAFDLDANAA